MEFEFDARRRFEDVTDAFYIEIELKAMQLAEDEGSETVGLYHIEDAYLTTIQAYQTELIEDSRFEILGKGGGDMCEELVTIMGYSALGDKGKILTRMFVDNKGSLNVKALADKMYDSDEWSARRAYDKFIKVFSNVVVWYFLRDVIIEIMSEKQAYILYRKMSGDTFIKIAGDLEIKPSTTRVSYYSGIRYLIQYLLFRSV